MPEPPILIQSITLVGFRAYLYATTFDFSEKPCFALFGPNGKGKSGLVDAFEFLLSEDGTIERLGIRATHNQAGVTALAHDLATEHGLATEVCVELKNGRTMTEAIRGIVGDRARPAALEALLARLRVDPIVRGYALRKFVEDQTPEDRYTEVAGWLQLSPLVEIQKNLRLLRQQLKADAEDPHPKADIDRQVMRITARVLREWSDAAALDFANGLLRPLDAQLALAFLDRNDPAYVTLVERVAAEEQQIGVAGLKQLKVAIEAVYAEPPGEAAAAGAIADFEQAVAAKEAAEAVESAERRAAATAVFAKVWAAAEPLFNEGAPSFEDCPVCATPLANTTAGSREAIAEHIRTHRAALAAYAAAKDALDKAIEKVATVHRRLQANLAVLRPLLPANETACIAAAAAYAEIIEQWRGAMPPESAELRRLLAAVLAATDAQIAEIEARQGNNTYARAKAKIDGLLEIKDQETLRVRTHEQLAQLLSALNEQATFISGTIRTKVQSLLDSLREPTNRLYRAIQGADAAPIRLDLPPEEDLNQQRLSLLIDFSPGRRGVAPSGYLSDSQVHSLALALRLAAIAAFNAGAPIAILDDIVTSYDADHRRAVAAMIAAHAANLQIILTTHDQRFFAYLKDQLGDSRWAYSQITRLDRDYGPRFAGHRISDEIIEGRWRDGESAANEMRQAEEEWLLDRCRQFGVDVRIREVDRAYAYERSELVSALAAYLKSTGLTPPTVPGVTNRFLVSLQKGEIENFGSHFQDGPYGDGSIGDEKARWEEFKFFRGHFVCPACSLTKFKRPLPLKKPVCAHQACEAQFNFGAASPVASQQGDAA